jgi:DNA repair exonuclease SbcCD ATPase subunit
MSRTVINRAQTQPIIAQEPPRQLPRVQRDPLNGFDAGRIIAQQHAIPCLPVELPQNCGFSVHPESPDEALLWVATAFCAINSVASLISGNPSAALGWGVPIVGNLSVAIPARRQVGRLEELERTSIRANQAAQQSQQAAEQALQAAARSDQTAQILRDRVTDLEREIGQFSNNNARLEAVVRDDGILQRRLQEVNAAEARLSELAVKTAETQGKLQATQQNLARTQIQLQATASKIDKSVDRAAGKLGDVADRLETAATAAIASPMNFGGGMQQFSHLIDVTA